MADPIYSKSDTPAKPSKLPPELVGKTPDEIAEYYERKNELVLENARRIVSAKAPAEKPAPKEEPDEKIDIFGDPTSSIKKLIHTEIREAVRVTTDKIEPNMVNTCRQIMRERHADWHRWSSQVEEAMKGMDAERRMNPEMWEIAYLNVLGRNVETIRNEAVENSKKPKSPIETPVSPGAPSGKPEELSDMEKVVAGKYDMTEDQYRDYKTRYESSEGVFPFTYDSRKPKQRKKAS
jgi:hypothetical protein